MNPELLKMAFLQSMLTGRNPAIERLGSGDLRIQAKPASGLDAFYDWNNGKPAPSWTPEGMAGGRIPLGGNNPLGGQPIGATPPRTNANLTQAFSNVYGAADKVLGQLPPGNPNDPPPAAGQPYEDVRNNFFSAVQNMFGGQDQPAQPSVQDPMNNVFAGAQGGLGAMGGFLPMLIQAFTGQQAQPPQQAKQNIFPGLDRFTQLQRR